MSYSNLQQSTSRHSQDSPSPSHARVDPERASSAASSVDTIYTTNPSSAVSSSDEYTEPTGGEYDYEEQDHIHKTGEDTPERQPYKHGALSPVQESPEYLSASSESLSYHQLEHDLNKALTKLTTEASGLNADQAALDSLETEIIQKTVTVTEGIPVDNNEEEQVQEDDFSSIPKTAPVLGLQVGHDRKNIANARKTRPPTRKVDLNQEQVAVCEKFPFLNEYIIHTDNCMFCRLCVYAIYRSCVLYIPQDVTLCIASYGIVL